MGNTVHPATFPIPFKGTLEERQDNLLSHNFRAVEDEDGRECTECATREYHTAAEYQCGTEPPRQTAPTRIAVHMEGGIIHAVGLISGEPVEVVFVDYDADGADPVDIKLIPQKQGKPLPAYISVIQSETLESNVTTDWIRNYKEKR